MTVVRARLVFSWSSSCFSSLLKKGGSRICQIRSICNKLHDVIIQEITEITATPLVPEIRLHLITPRCSLWDSRPECCPVPDPYWAFLWPGGQAVCRYLLDNPSLCKGKNVLDIGSGAGASMIASLKCGANFVFSNDIDRVAISAMDMNLKINFEPHEHMEIRQRVLYSDRDVLPTATNTESDVLLSYTEMLSELPVSDGTISTMPAGFDLVLVGDLLYDDDVAARLLILLGAIKKFSPRTSILIGDPGRSAFLEHLSLRSTLLARYDLPVSSAQENYGFSSVAVYRFH